MPAARRLFFALNIFALVMAGIGLAGGMPTARPPAAMPGGCAHHCRGNAGGRYDPAGMPGCGVFPCAAAAIVTPRTVVPSAPRFSATAYFHGPIARLRGLAAGTDPPPPKSLPTL